MDRRPAPRGGRIPTALLATTLTGALSCALAVASAPAANAVTYSSPQPVPFTGAVLQDASGVAVSSGGTVYVLDGAAGAVVTVTGGTAVATPLNGVSSPQGIALSGSTLYVADTGNHRVVSLPVPTSATAVTPVRVAGLGTGAAGAPVNGTATSSPLSSPKGVAVDASGALYIADTGNNQVERVVGGALTIVAGTGFGAGPELPGPASSSPLSAPTDVAVDGSGALYIADTGNGAVAKVASGALSTFAAVTAPTSLAADASGTVFAGSGTSVLGLSAAGGSAATSSVVATGLLGPAGLAASSSGAVLVADDDASSPRLVSLSPASGSLSAPRVTSPAPTTAGKGQPLSLRFTASGFPAPSWSFVGAAPAGITAMAIDPATGAVTGTPSATGTVTFTVRASNTQGHDDQVVTLLVGSVPAALAAKPVAVAGRGSAVVTWAAPAASAVAGEAVTGYVVTPWTGTTAGKPVTLGPSALTTSVPGLAVGAPVTFTVAATNAYGTAAASAASTAVTPYAGAVAPAGGVTRYDGANRVVTAVTTSQRLFPAAGSARAVVVASSTSYADSLAGARLASAVGGPLLLTDPASLNSAVADEVKRVLVIPPTTSTATASTGTALAAATSTGSATAAPSGPSALGTVFVLGGTAAVSADVQTALTALSSKYTVTRLMGDDRYATAVKVAAQVDLDAPVAEAPIYAASGTNYPDGLAVAALAARTGGVVVLTSGGTMPAATAAYLAKFDPNGDRVVPVGGPAAAAVGSRGAGRALVGTDRYDTARLVAARFTADAGSAKVPAVGLATGENWPDALAGAAAMGNLGGPLLLTPSAQLSPAVGSAVGALSARGRPSAGLVFGGTSVVSGGAAASFGALVGS